MMTFINARSCGTHFVVQKYIERPLLYHNRKFDIRVWAVMTTKNEIFFYKQGYLRTSSSEYDLDDQNQHVHLTNQCLQVKNKEIYGQHEEGNTLSFQQFQEYLDSEDFLSSRSDIKKGQNVVIERDLVPRIKDIIIDSFCAVKAQINPNHRKNHFELFGYDFMVDEDFRVWLIEINSNPYLGTPNKFTKQLVPAMVDELLNLTLDPLFPPASSYKPPKVRHFELIYQESQCHISPPTASAIDRLGYRFSPFRGFDLQLVNQRRPFNLNLIYPLKVNEQNAVKAAAANKSSKGNVRAKNKDGSSLQNVNSSASLQAKEADRTSASNFQKRKKSYKSGLSQGVQYRVNSIYGKKLGPNPNSLFEQSMYQQILA